VTESKCDVECCETISAVAPSVECSYNYHSSTKITFLITLLNVKCLFIDIYTWTMIASQF